jgi:hypothetical protein
MRRWLGTTFVLATVSALALTTSSCGGSAAAPTNDSACQAYAAAVCGELQSCFGGALALEYGTVDGCKSRLMISCTAAITAPSTGLTPSYVNTCAGAESGLACSAIYQDQVPAVCAPMTGSLGDGAPCFDGAQCKTGFCPHAATTNCGTCTAAPAAGGACVSGQCPSGLSCNSSNQCAKRASAGQACTTASDCETDLTCTAGKCGAPAKAGEACSSDGKTVPRCDNLQTLVCNGKTNKCEAAKVAAVGAACGLDLASGGIITCSASSYCQTVDAKTFQGKCIARAADGAACATDGLLGSTSCSAPATCISGTCKLPDPTTCK